LPNKKKAEAAQPELTALVCLSTFKGRLSNEEACATVSEALKAKHIACRPLPLGDGGAGTLRTVHAALGGDIVEIKATGPLGKPATAKVLLLPNSASPTSIYVESSDVCGHALVPEGERDALRATSQGLGEVIGEGVKRWGDSLKRIYVGLGDSAVSDVGLGMLCGLGYKFFDRSGRPVWGNAAGLRQIETFQDPKNPKLSKIKFTVLCDVMNPLCGPRGSARTFAPQKGATPGQVSQIDQGMEHFASILQATSGRNLRFEPMTGSAGGLAAAFLAFFDTELVHGARFLLDWIHFDRILSDHAFLIVGEGKTDFQTLSGKAPLEGLERAGRLGKKVVVISGVLGDGHEQLLTRVAGCFACGDSPTAKDALYARTLEIFSDEELLKSLC